MNRNKFTAILNFSSCKVLLSAAVLIFCFNLSEAQVNVTFKINALPSSTPLPKTVYNAGSFNGWSPASQKWQFVSDNSGGYQLKQTLAPGNYEYKITRGSWNTVECGAGGSGFQNRTLHLAHDTTLVLTIADWQDMHPVIERKHTASSQVHIISESFNMPQLGTERRIWVYLPKGYEKSRKKYPVIYMHDGQNLFDEYTSGFGEWGIDEFLDSLKIGSSQVIIVGIDHAGEKRMIEYNPYNSTYGTGRGDDYIRFLAETLKPYIDAHYHTFADARHTTVAGSSMGGIISMYAELKYPQVFGNAGIFSPAFWIGPAIYDFAKLQALKTSRFYFVCGDAESDKETSDMNKMVAILKDKGLPGQNIPSVIVKGAKHNEAQWRSDFPAFYGWLMK